MSDSQQVQPTPHGEDALMQEPSQPSEQTAQSLDGDNVSLDNANQVSVQIQQLQHEQPDAGERSNQPSEQVQQPSNGETASGAQPRKPSKGPFPCKEAGCNEEFSTRDQRQIHVNSTHPQKKGRWCPTGLKLGCPYRKSDRTLMEQHLRTNHKIPLPRRGTDHGEGALKRLAEKRKEVFRQWCEEQGIDDGDMKYFEFSQKYEYDVSDDELELIKKNRYSKFGHDEGIHKELIAYCTELEQKPNEYDPTAILKIIQPSEEDYEAFKAFFEEVLPSFIRVGEKIATAREIANIVRDWLLHYPFVQESLTEKLQTELTPDVGVENLLG